MVKKELPIFSLKTVLQFTSPLRAYFGPRFFGLDHIDADRPSLYVGNHPLFALDYPIMAAELYKRKGFLLRPLGDHAHWSVPLWAPFLTRLGVIDGTRENCAKAMEAGLHIVVFPGGGRESFKHRGEAYQLIWKKRTGFARMAIQHGYPIIPFASKGADSLYHILLDGPDVTNLPILSKILAVTGLKKWSRDGELIPPLVRGIGPTIIPRPERFYFSFGEPIDTARYAGKHEDKDALFALRDEVADALKTQLTILLHILDQDTEHSFWRRLLTRL